VKKQQKKILVVQKYIRMYNHCSIFKNEKQFELEKQKLNINIDVDNCDFLGYHKKNKKNKNNNNDTILNIVEKELNLLNNLFYNSIFKKRKKRKQNI